MYTLSQNCFCRRITELQREHQSIYRYRESQVNMTQQNSSDLLYDQQTDVIEAELSDQGKRRVCSQLECTYDRIQKKSEIYQMTAVYTGNAYEVTSERAYYICYIAHFKVQGSIMFKERYISFGVPRICC